MIVETTYLPRFIVVVDVEDDEEEDPFLPSFSIPSNSLNNKSVFATMILRSGILGGFTVFSLDSRSSGGVTGLISVKIKQYRVLETF